jgi:hypothetical protein
MDGPSCHDMHALLLFSFYTRVGTLDTLIVYQKSRSDSFGFINKVKSSNSMYLAMSAHTVD